MPTSNSTRGRKWLKPKICLPKTDKTMLARTRILNPKCEIYFCYEDYDGNRYGNYDALVKEGRKPFALCGYLYSFWFNNSELIDERYITRRPTRKEVADFMESCKRDIINH